MPSLVSDKTIPELNTKKKVVRVTREIVEDYTLVDYQAAIERMSMRVDQLKAEIKELDEMIKKLTKDGYLKKAVDAIMEKDKKDRNANDVVYPNKKVLSPVLQ